MGLISKFIFFIHIISLLLITISLTVLIGVQLVAMLIVQYTRHRE